MPRMTFSNDNKTNQRDDFPKLKLEQAEEKGRIWCPELPVAEYVHNLKMPKLENGRQAFKTVKDKDGNDKQVPEFDFVSRPLCLGDVNVIAENGLDPKHCPVCREAMKSDIVEKPVRRFAMHVVRYSTKTDGTAQKPLQASVNVWAFTDFMFGKLVDISNEYGALESLDIVLTLKNKLFQQYDLMASPNSWRKDEKVAALLDEVLKENQAKDLSAFCGRTTKRDFMEADILKIRERWEIVQGRSASSNSLAAAEQSTLSEGLGDLLNGSDTKPAVAKKEEPKADAPAEAVDFNALFG